MTDFITLASTPGGFAAMCRCGKPACFTHKQTVDPSRVILPPTAEPASFSKGAIALFPVPPSP